MPPVIDKEKCVKCGLCAPWMLLKRLKRNQLKLLYVIQMNVGTAELV